MAIRISREFKVGMYLVIAIFVLYWGFNFLKGNDVFANDKVFYAVYDNTEGLTPAKAMGINGYQIGMIDEIYFHPTKPGKLIVKLKQLKDYPIPRNSIASIHSAGLLGEKSIQLLLGDSKELAESGDTLRSSTETSLTDEVSAQVAPIKAKAENLLASLDTAVGLLTGFLTPTTQRNFEASFASLRNTFDNLEKTSIMLNDLMQNNKGNLDRIINNLDELSNTLAGNTDNINNVLTNFSNITDSLQKANITGTVDKVNHAMGELDQIITKVNAGEGSVGALVNDQALYNNLEDATYSLNRLLLDLKYNPNKYLNFSVFGNSRYYTEEEIQALEIELKKRRKVQEDQDREIDSKRN